MGGSQATGGTPSTGGNGPQGTGGAPAADSGTPDDTGTLPPVDDLGEKGPFTAARTQSTGPGNRYELFYPKELCAAGSGWTVHQKNLDGLK
jgi:hypothetical protein